MKFFINLELLLEAQNTLNN